MSSEMHPLAGRYLDAIFELPDTLRARKDLDDELAAHMTGGHHLCIRGFRRFGKTTLMTGILARACERSSGAALILDLRDETREDGLPQTVDAVLAKVTRQVNAFLDTVGAKEVRADAKKPLEALGELAAPLYVGVDDAALLVALGPAGMAQAFEALLVTPKNVKVAVVCARHRDLDAVFEEHVVNRGGVATVMVPPVTDDELVTLVQTPADEFGVTFENEALGAIAEITGNRPYEIFQLCALLASRLAKDFKGAITPEQVDALVDFDILGESESGQALIDLHLRALVTEMNVEERTVMELLAAGKEGEATEDALVRLQEASFVVASDEGYDVNGALIAFVTRAIVEGVIKVTA